MFDSGSSTLINGCTRQTAAAAVRDYVNHLLFESPPVPTSPPQQAALRAFDQSGGGSPATSPLSEAELRERADRGDPQAMKDLGVRLVNSGRVDEGNVWSERAANLGHADAMRNMGIARLNESNFSEAEEWFRRSAESGNLDAFRLRGLIHHRFTVDLSRAVELYEEGAAAGSTSCMNNLGAIYRFSLDDLALAERWLRRAAGLGDSLAMANLASLCFQDGRTAESRQWLDAAIVSLAHDSEPETAEQVISQVQTWHEGLTLAEEDDDVQDEGDEL